MSLAWIWTGAPTHEGVRLRARVTGASARVMVSTQQSMAGAVYHGPYTPTTLGIITADITGLQPGTRYWAAIDDGTPDLTWLARWRTLAGAPGEAVSHRVASWSCAGLSPRFPGALPYTSTHPALDIITDVHDPDILVQTGDIHYGNIAVNDAAQYRTAFEGVLNRTGTPRMSRHLAQCGNLYVWDDHDFGPNDSDSTSPGAPAAQQVYREYVPHGDLPSPTGAVYQARQIGRVLHLVSDTRSARDPDDAPDTPTKTMLGAEQLAWMEGVLSTSTAEALVWYMPSQWMGEGRDTWAAYTHERQRLVEMLQAPGGDDRLDWTRRMVQVSGDVHAIAMDDGGGNRWGGFPVYVAASIDSSGDNMQGNIYMQGGRYVPSSPGRGRYGILDIADDGDSITIDTSLYIGSWRKFRHQWTLSLTVDPADEIFSASDVEGVAEIDWSAGDWFGAADEVPAGYQQQTITDWSISRELATDLPDAMRTATGLSVAGASTGVAAPSGATLGHWSPWRHPQRYLHAPLRLAVDADGTRYQRFVGETDSAGSDSAGVKLAVTALDMMAALDIPVDLPAFAGQMGSGYNPGCSATWVAEHVLSQFGAGALPGQGPSCLYYQSLAGSTMTGTGAWERSTDPQTATGEPTWEYASDMPYLVPTYHGSRLGGAELDGTGGLTGGLTFGGLSGAPVSETSSTYTLELVLRPPDQVWSRFLTVQHTSTSATTTLTVTWQLTDGTDIDQVAWSDIPLGQWWVTFAPTSSGWTCTLLQPGQPARTATLGTDVDVSGEITPVYGNSFGRASCTLAAQILAGSSYTLDDLPGYDPDRARIAAPDVDIVGVPDIAGATGKTVLQQLASATQGAFWFDENGLAVFESRGELRGVDKTPIPVRSEVSLLDPGPWTTNIDQIRSRVEVPVNTPVATVSSSGWVQVWDADTVITVYGGETLDILVDLPTAVGGISGTLWPGNVSGGCWFRGNRALDGSGSFIAATRANAGRVYQVSATRARVVWTNRYSYPVHFVDSDGEPALHIGARWAMSDGTTITVAEDTGVRGTVLALPANPWRQTRTDAVALARWLAQETSAPRPYLEQLQVAWDPRIRLGSVIDLRDPDRYGISLTCLVRAVDEAASAGQISMRLSVQPLRITLGAVDDAHRGMTLADLDAYWTGRTLAEFDLDPLEGARNALYQAGHLVRRRIGGVPAWVRRTRWGHSDVGGVRRPGDGPEQPGTAGQSAHQRGHQRAHLCGHSTGLR